MEGISTNSVIIARYAGAMYNVAAGYTTAQQVLNDVSGLGSMNAYLNQIYAADFSQWPTLAVANRIATNLGLTGPLFTEASNYITARLNATDPAQRGTLVKDLLNQFGQMVNDPNPLWAAAATKWATMVSDSVAFSNNPNNTVGITLPAPVVSPDQGQTFSLTLNQDTLTGTPGADTFNANVLQNAVGVLGNSLQNVDSINGGAGIDKLVATLDGAGATPTLVSVEKIMVTTANAQTLDLTNATGVTDIEVTGGAATATVAKVGNTANFAVTSTKQDATFTGNTATSITLTTTDAGTIKSATTPAVVSTITFDNVPTNLAVKTSNSNTKLAGAASVETLSVDATGANVFDTNASAGKIKTITATGKGSVDMTATAFTALTKVDASANGGGVSLQADAKLVNFIGGAGADKVTFTAAIAATANIALGDGNDTVTIAGASNKGAVVAGGGGTNTLAVTNGAFIDANATKTYTGFQILEIGGGTGAYDTGLITGVTGVSLSGTALAGNVDLKNVVAGSTLTVSSKTSTDLTTGKDITYALKDATGTADSLSVTLNAKDGDNDSTPEGQITVTKLEANGIESISVASELLSADTDVAATKYTNTISALNGDAVKTLTFTGDANLTVTATNITTATKVDASAATGKTSINLSGNATALQFLGGSAADTYTGSGKGDTINAAKGGDNVTLTTFASVDTLILAAGDSQLTSKADAFDTVTNFGTTAGGAALDVFDLGAFGFTGTMSSALANKGALPNSAIDGSTLTQADWFSSGGVDRAVAIGTNGGNTYVYIDVNKDGDFTATADLFVKLAGVTDVTLANFGF